MEWDIVGTGASASHASRENDKCTDHTFAIWKRVSAVSPGTGCCVVAAGSPLVAARPIPNASAAHRQRTDWLQLCLVNVRVPLSKVPSAQLVV